jgi:hypothetical protein
LTHELPLEKVLNLLEFEKTPLGYGRQWGDLVFSITESFNCWFLIRGSHKTQHEFSLPHEVRVMSRISPIEMMALIYRLWAEVHTKQEPLDECLVWGEKWTSYRRQIKALIPPPPSIWADREYLRFCLTYIERQRDWVDHDYEIRFSQIPGQLRIKALETEVYCPARGNWIDESIISAKDLFRRLPKRFIGDVVVFQNKGNKLMIDSREIPARFSELQTDQ